MDKYESNIVYSLAMDIRRGMFCISMASWVKAHKGQHMMVIQSLMVDPSIPFCSRILPRMFTHSMMLRMGTKYARPETFEMHVTVLWGLTTYYIKFYKTKPKLWYIIVEQQLESRVD